MRVIRKKIDTQFKLQIQTPDGYREFPATIPGSVHTDLIAAGVIGDIRTTGSEPEQAWIKNTDSKFSVEIPAQTQGNHELHFAGLDTLASISINSEIKLTTQNMHRLYVLPIEAKALTNLEIAFKAPLPEALRREEVLGSYPNPYNMPYNYLRKMACSFGWDWGPITGTSGIWKPITLVTWDQGILDEVTVIGNVVNEIPKLIVRVKGRGSAADVRISVSGNHNAVFTTTLNSENEFVLEGFDLWQPRGYGTPTLYDVRVELLNETGEILDEVIKRIGFRSVELDQSNYEDRQMFAIKVNGQRIWARGVNWIPDDPFPHRVTKAKYEEKIKDLCSVEVNAIRVWGGGIYESDDFYDLCDEAGIIVWQDFLFACAAYPETLEFESEITQEAKEAVSRLSNHPSLVLWCGGNECIEGFQHWGWQEKLHNKLWGSKYYHEILPRVLSEIDGTRAYIPGSPYSTLVEDVKNFASGTNHIWDVWNERGYQRYEEYSPSFAAEFGYNGPGSWRTLTRAINKTNLDSRDIELTSHQKAFDGMSKIAAGLKREFVKMFSDGPEWYFAAQLVQARAVEVGLKHFRSQYLTCSGSMLWQYNDMWPALSWAVLDSAGSRKLSWYAMREAYRPRVLHFSGTNRDVVVINDSTDIWHDDLIISIFDQAGLLHETLKFALSIDKESHQRIKLSDKLPIQGFVVAQLGDIRTARTVSDDPISSINPHEIEISPHIDGNKVVLRIHAKSFIHELSFLPELVAQEVATVSVQRLTLIPGDNISVEITASNSQDAQLIVNSLEEITWSLNKLVSGPSQ